MGSEQDEKTQKLDRTPSRIGRLTRGGAAAPLYWAVPLAIAVLIGVAGIFGYRVIKESFRDDLKSELETLLEADKEALKIWIAGQCRLAEMLAARPTVGAAAAKVNALATTGSATAEGLKTSGAVAELSQAVEPELERIGFEGFALLDPAGKVLASSDLGSIGTRLPAAVTALMGGILDGNSRLLPPYAPASEAAEAPSDAVMFVATPLRSGGAGATAVLAFNVPIARDFTRILSIARLGRTGETYAFDRDGRLLSESRFEDDLRKAGLLAQNQKSTLNVEIRDPGGNLLEGHRTDLGVRERPFTRMAAAAIAGKNGYDIDGYRDYRGVPVVGAWEWVKDLDLGMTTEVDVAEAYRPLHLLNLAFWMLFGAAMLAGLLLSVGSIVINKLHRTVRDVKQLGQYTLVEKIGEGAMGKVYRASHAMLRRPTAVKLLEAREPGALERFEREVQLTSQLSHPNTIAIYDFGRTPEGIFYYAMEYLEGIDLADLIKLGGPVPPARVVHILRQVCGSLAEAHAQGFVHRDIKPSNIMLSMRGGEPDVVKVLDFGLVKRVDRNTTMLTTMGVVFGTPGYIPPETLRDSAIFDHRGDIYAVGAVAYELLSGHSVFARTTVYELCRQHVEIEPETPSERIGRRLPPILEAVVMTCLAKDPMNRPQTIMDLRHMLETCEDVGPWSQADARAWWAARAADVAALRSRPRPDALDSARTLSHDEASAASA